jgi:hypothetical protein
MRNLLFVFILTLSLFSLFIYIPFHSPIEQMFTSPLPDYLSMDKNKQVTLLDLWSPLLESVYGSEIKGPSPQAESHRARFGPLLAAPDREYSGKHPSNQTPMLLKRTPPD